MIYAAVYAAGIATGIALVIGGWIAYVRIWFGDPRDINKPQP